MPLRTLPGELIGTILEECATIENDGHFPLRIALVNRLFRDVAHGTAALWSTIIVDKVYEERYISLWVVRSKSRPLEVDIRSVLSTEASRVLAQTCARWRSLQVTGASIAEIQRMIAPYNHAEFIQLKSAQIYSNTSEFQAIFPIRHDHLDLASPSSLTALKFTNYCKGCVSKMLKSCPINLTHLAISHFSPTYQLLVDLFAQARVSTLILDEFIHFSAEVSQEPLSRSIDASSLTTLAVGFGPGHVLRTGSCSCCLPWLFMPNLQHLEIVSLSVLTDVNRHLSIHSGFSYPHVRTLKIGGKVLDADFCTAFPNVIELHTHFLWPIYGGVYSSGRLDPRLWPDLRTIMVDFGMSSGKFSVKGLVEWVKTRQNLDHPMDLVQINKRMQAGKDRHLERLHVLVKVEVVDIFSPWLLLRKNTGTVELQNEGWDSDAELEAMVRAAESEGND